MEVIALGRWHSIRMAGCCMVTEFKQSDLVSEERVEVAVLSEAIVDQINSPMPFHLH